MSSKIVQQNKISTVICTLKLEYLKWVLSLFITLIVTGIVVKLVDVFYHPDIASALDKAKQILISPGGVSPEPKEKLMFMASLMTAVVSLFLSYYIINNYFEKSNKKTSDGFFMVANILSGCAFVYVTYKVLYGVNPPQNAQEAVGKNNKDFYFINTFIYKNLFLFMFFIYPAILGALTYSFKVSHNVLSSINKWIRFFSAALCISIIIVVCFIAAFSFPYTFENKYDLNAVYYSVVQVYNGFPLLVDNFTNTYGLYPEFILPVLKLNG